MSMKQRLAIVEGFNSFVISFEKSILKNTCNRKILFDKKDTDLSSIELKKFHRQFPKIFVKRLQNFESMKAMKAS